MAKLLLLSLLAALVIVPARAASDPDPRSGLRKAIVHALWFNFFYLLALMFIYPRLNAM